MHVAWPVSFVYVPDAHVEQLLAPETANFPAEHFVRTLEPSQFEPARQAVHAVRVVASPPDV